MSDLSAPLSRRKARRKAAAQLVDRPPRQLPIARTAVAVLALIAIGLALRVLLVSDPEGGRPAQSVAIAAATDTNPVAGANSSPAPMATLTADPETDASAPDDSDAVDLPTTAASAAVIEPDLTEETEFGPIPRMSGSGRTPFEAYSQPSDTPATAAGKPLVAIIVSGLGLDASGTMEAISKLPTGVTLAFAPYGKDLEKSVETARGSGHEVFLEVPLEPFDYPDNDPGPDTLLTGKAPRENLNKLFSVMARFEGYAGVINNMGARFTASGADFGPIMEELGSRGLGYVDDGSSNRSLAPQLAAANRVPFGRVTIPIDANPSRGAILDQLKALVDKATADGQAIGIISALPVSIETVTDWSNDAEKLGVEIVPASALMKS